LKRKLLTVGLILTLSLNSFGCGSTLSQPESPKQTTKALEPGSQETTTKEPSAPSEPASPKPGKSGSNNTAASVQPKQTVAGEAEAPSPKEPSAPAKPSLPQGPISIKVGETLPDFTLSDLNGNNVNASTIVTRHKLTFINFWATT